MKRVLLAATLALSAGCYSSPPSPPIVNLNLYWHFVGRQGQTYGDGTQANTGCAEAGVDTVSVTLTDPTGYTYAPQSFPCVQSNGVPGVTYPGLYAGGYAWIVAGYRGSLPVYSVTQTNQPVNPDSTGNATVDVAPAALYPDLNVTYDLPATVTCSAASIVQVSFELDQGGALYYTNAGSATSPGFGLPCADPPQNVFTVPSLPAGTNYQFSYIEALASTGPVYEACGLLVIQTSQDPASSMSANLTAAGGQQCP